MLSHMPVPRWPQFNRWFTLLIGACMMACDGTGYLFSVYAPQLKEILDYDQRQINLVATLAGFGNSFGVFAGMFYDFFGPRPTLLVSALFICGGQSLMWAAAMKFFPSNYILLAFFLGCMGLGGTAAYLSVLSTNIFNFHSKHRGKVVGFMAALYGLSSALFTQIYNYFFKPDILSFLLFLAISITSVILFGTIFINKRTQPPESRRSSLKRKAEQPVITVEPTNSEILSPQQSQDSIDEATPLVPHLLPDSQNGGVEPHIHSITNDSVGVAWNDDTESVTVSDATLEHKVEELTHHLLHSSHHSNAQPQSPQLQQEELLQSPSVSDLDPGQHAPDTGAILDPSENTVHDSSTPPAKSFSLLRWLHTSDIRGQVQKRPWELFLSLSFYVLCLALFCGAGSGLTVIFNIGAIVRAFGGNDTDTVRLVTLLSIFNCTGRLATGAISDRLARWLSRPFFLMACLMLMSIVHAGLSFTDNVLWLYPVVVFVGFAYGGIYAIFPTFVSERYGVKHFGVNFNLVNTAAFVASNVYAWISGRIYDMHINAENRQCFGIQCYQWTFWITSASCAFGTVLCLLLILLNRKFYSSHDSSRVIHTNIQINKSDDEVGHT